MQWRPLDTELRTTTPRMSAPRQFPPATARRAAAGIALLCIAFGAVAGVGITRSQPVSSDEAIILSISATLSAQGELGAPVFAGIHNAEHHYFLSLPGIHLLHWPVFKLFGAGMVQARAVSVAVAVAGAAVAGLAAWRAGGPLTSLLAVGLLLFWRSGMIDSGYGLTWLSAARSARYDVAAATLILVSVLLLDRWLRRANLWSSLALGLATGAAMLLHFTAWVLPFTVLAAWAANRHRPAVQWLAAASVASLLVFVPYGAFVARHAPDATAQFTLVHGPRARAAAGGVLQLLSNAIAEPHRYTGQATTRGLGPLLVPAALIGALVWLTQERRYWKAWAAIFWFLVTDLLFLALLEPAKAALYELPLFAPLCIVVAAMVTRPQRRRGRLLRIAVLALPLLLLLEGEVVLVHELGAERQVLPYAVVAQQIEQAVGADGIVTGPFRWWPGLQQRSFVPFPALVLRWREAEQSHAAPAFWTVLRQAGVRYVIRTPELNAELARAPAAVRDFMVPRLQACGVVVGGFAGPAYGPLTIIQLDAECMGAADH